ncbi:MAG: cardiolipin synthase [Fermentimonas sp.]|jgi:cardiolipin synthase
MQINTTVLLIIEIIYILTVLSVVLVVISENRDPVRSVAWILAVIFLPVIGVIWYALFGQDITKKHVISKRMYSKLKRRPLDEMGTPVEQYDAGDHENLVNLLRNMDYNPVLGGNSVELFTTGKDKFERLFEDIRNAREHIHIEYYVFMDDKLGLRLKNLLIEKSKEGVEIRIIYDSFGSRKIKKSFLEDYRKAGIEIEPFLKLTWNAISSRLNYRNHRKIVVIDGRVGYIGGMNVADRYIDGFDWGIWRDTHARIEGKGVQGLQSVFFIDWYFVSQTLITSRKYFPLLDNYGDAHMQIVNSGPNTDSNQIANGILQAIYDAKKSICIQTPYFLPPDSMSDGLQAAAVRGVDVRIMMSGRSDVPLVQLASRSFIKEMLESGVKVYFYNEGFLHSKLMTFDDSLTIIGSANFDARSFSQNFEVVSFVYDEDIARKANEIFVEDLRTSSMLTLREWKKRPRHLKFIESILRLFAPLL